MVKVLLCGDINGNLTSLFKRVEAINSSSAVPFDILLCVGKLLSEENGSAAALEEYQSGSSQVPIPMYFYEVGLDRGSVPQEWATAKGGNVAPNLYYLGAAGFSMLKNLAIGYVSSSATAEELQNMLKNTKKSSYIGADMLLSSQWPRGVDVNMAQSAVDQLSEVGVSVTAVGSSQIAEVARLLKPRYHFAASEGVFFQRQPYRNSESIPDKREVHTTRFISLGKIGKTKDKARKWLHALALDPVGAMTLEALATEPPGTTSCPYLQRSTGLKRKSTGTSGFGEMAAARIEQEEENKRRGSGTFFFGDTTGKRRSGQGRRKTNPEDEILQKLAEEDPEMKTLFVGNLKPDSCTPEDLETVFEQCGKVLAARVTPGKSFGFVDLETHESALKAVKLLNGALIGGNPVDVRWAKKNSAQRVREQTPKKQRECWFCLSSPSVETHLIVSIAEEVYLASPKGALVADHVQIIPINHIARVSDLSSEGFEEVQNYKKSLQMYYNSMGMALVTFERNMATSGGSTSHMYIEAMPVSVDKLASAKQVFQEEGEAVGSFFEDVDENDKSLKTLLSKDQKYFYFELYPASGVSPVTKMIHWIEESLSSKAKFNLQFGREVMAKIYNIPQRANWKNCTLSTEEETKQSDQFKRKFKTFDFSLQ